MIRFRLSYRVLFCFLIVGFPLLFIRAACLIVCCSLFPAVVFMYRVGCVVPTFLVVLFVPAVVICFVLGVF